MRPKWMLVRPWGLNCLILEAKTFKISPERLPKSVKYQGCGADALLERSWAPKRCSHPSFPGPFWEPFSTKNRKKSKKCYPKRHAKFYVEKESKLMPKACQSDPKVTPKWFQSNPRVIPKVTPKWSQSDGKVTPKWWQSDPRVMVKWPQSGGKVTPEWW